MSNNNKLDVFKGELNSQSIRAQLRNSLKEDAGAFMSSMLDLYSSDRSLQKCDPRAVALECVKAAALKLPIVKSLGFAYVVPYKNVPTFTIGYKGLIQLAQRSGLYQTINADIVYEGEITKRNKLSGMMEIDGEATSDKPVGYFCYFKTVNGFEKLLYMTVGEVEAWGKRYSPSYNSAYSPWKTEFDKMAMKTTVRRLIGTYGPMSIEMQKAFEADEPEQVAEKEEKANANTIHIDPDSGEVVDVSDKEQKTENEREPTVEDIMGELA